MKIEKIDRIYISHYTKLTDRKEYLQKALSFVDNEIRWIEEFDREDLTEDIIKKYIAKDVRYPKEMNAPAKNGQMNLAEIGCSISHFYAFNEIVEKGFQNAILFEDDIVILPEFSNLNEYLKEIPSDFDIIHIGDYLGRKPRGITKGRYIYREGAGKGGASYIVSHRFAERVKDIKIRRVVDRFLDDLHPRIYWLYPPVCIQGTKNGKYKSAVR